MGSKRADYNLASLMPGNEVWITVDATGAPAIECDHLVKGQRICFEAEID